MATLVVLQGPDKGRTHKTDDPVVIIGRGSEQVPLHDQTVSRRHAELKAISGGWALSDLNSANGTYLNGVRLSQPKKLKPGDQIRMGGTLMVYAGDETLEQLAGAKIPIDMVTLDASSSPLDSAVMASVPSNEDSVIMAGPDVAYAVRSWQAMRELTDVIGSLLSPDQLLPRVMDILFEQVEIDRGVIFIRDEATKEFLPEVVRFHSRKARAEATKNSIVASRTIINHVVETRQGVLCSDVVGDERFRSGKSVHNLTLRSVICVPILTHEHVLGVIHLDCPLPRHTYNEHELKLVTAIGYQTGLAIENARLVQAQLERERLAAAGETVAYLSHSIKNILQNLRAGSDVMQRGLDRQDLKIVDQGWRILNRNLDKCYALMMNMLAFSKQREPNLAPEQVNKVVEEVVELTQAQADDSRIVLLADLDETVPPIPLDHDGLHQVILNLVANALDAVPRTGGVINVRTRFEKADRRVVISVQDNGPGVPEADREKIFQPFHSTKGHGGTGLGLAVARKIVTEMGGILQHVQPKEGGAQFDIRLPSAELRQPGPGDTHGPR